MAAQEKNNTNAGQQAQQLAENPMGQRGPESSMTGAFDIAGEARRRGRIDDDVAWRGVETRREAKKNQLSP